MNIENCRIHRTFLGVQEHSILTASIYVDMEDGSVMFGGLTFDGPAPVPGGQRIGSSACAVFIRSMCEIAGVDKWEDLKGCYCRIEFDNNGRSQKLGHIIENKWTDSKGVITAMSGK